MKRQPYMHSETTETPAEELGESPEMQRSEPKEPASHKKLLRAAAAMKQQAQAKALRRR